jgi:hypothetical protein
MVYDIQPQTPEQHHVWLTVGGNPIDLPDGVSTPTHNLTTCNVLCNIVVTTPHEKNMAMNINTCYFGTPVSGYVSCVQSIHQ